MYVSVSIRNESSSSEELLTVLEPADGVMFSGRRLGILQLLPHEEQTLRFSVVPTQVGRVALPMLRIGPIAPRAPAIEGAPAPTPVLGANAVPVGPLFAFVQPEPLR